LISRREQCKKDYPKRTVRIQFKEAQKPSFISYFTDDGQSYFVRNYKNRAGYKEINEQIQLVLRYVYRCGIKKKSTQRYGNRPSYLGDLPCNKNQETGLSEASVTGRYTEKQRND
jgi:hypothetical protein